MQNNGAGLSVLMERGGVYHDIPGKTAQEVLTCLIGAVKMPAGVDREKLLEAVLEREALMSTAVGKGIALPHPRNPIVSNAEAQLVITAFLEEPVNWNALDGQPVHTAILIVSASAKLHLGTLSQLNFFCQQESFYRLLQNRSRAADIIRFVKDAEQEWSN
ncbi:hypothetical protein AGMMS49928_16720 [Spirochaetia bacterium]|nr:hypothetical protein AGMMS49928_16720 [Spirochaetia bacterium]